MAYIYSAKTEYNGIRFDSYLEVQFYKFLEKEAIQIEAQVPFLFKGTPRAYRMDFVLTHPSGRIYYVDTKSARTLTLLSKFKVSLIEAMYNIRIDFVFKDDFQSYLAYMNSGETYGFGQWKQLSR